MSKHTPGPWIFEKDGGRDTEYDIFSEADSRKMIEWRKANPTKLQDSFSGVSICRTAIHWNGSGDSVGPKDGLIGRDEFEANVRLLAAAPDLLAVCERLVAWDANPNGWEELEQIGADAIDAIAKAKAVTP